MEKSEKISGHLVAERANRVIQVCKDELGLSPSETAFILEFTRAQVMKYAGLPRQLYEVVFDDDRGEFSIEEE